MSRFLKGFAAGLALGALLAWLYQRYLGAGRETVPAGRPLGTRAAPDDFAALRGIGQVFAERLQQAGIRTYADLARLTPAEVSDCCQVPAWRVQRDDWIGQAAAQV